MLSTESVRGRAAVTKKYEFRPSSTDVDRGMNSLNALLLRYFIVSFLYILVQPVSEKVCYCFSRSLRGVVVKPLAF